MTTALILIQTRARTSGLFRLGFVGGVVASEYLLVFVLVAQAFLKVAPLHSLAPTGSEPPFAIAQVIVLVAFLVLGVFVARSFRPQSMASRRAADAGGRSSPGRGRLDFARCVGM